MSRKGKYDNRVLIDACVLGEISFAEARVRAMGELVKELVPSDLPPLTSMEFLNGPDNSLGFECFSFLVMWDLCRDIDPDTVHAWFVVEGCNSRVLAYVVQHHCYKNCACRLGNPERQTWFLETSRPTVAAKLREALLTAMQNVKACVSTDTNDELQQQDDVETFLSFYANRADL
jgi:hypothetical protein